jgi:hypothetical protein
MFPSKVNFSTIGKVAEVSDSAAAFVLKQILTAIHSCIRKEIAVKLNLKVGLIKINSSGTLNFTS